MWTQFVFNALCEEEKDLFFSCLIRSKLDSAKSGKKYTLINNDNCKELFCNYFQIKEKFSRSNISSTAYYCYKRIMIRYNLIKNCLKEDRDQLHIINGNLEGILTLWEMIYNSSEARDDGIPFIIQLYYSIYKGGKTTLDVASSSVGQFSAKYTTTAEMVPICLKILKTFLLRFDDFRYFKINKKAYKTAPSTQRRCFVYRPDGSKMMFKIKSN